MIYIFFIFIIFVGGGALLGRKVSDAIAPDDYDSYRSSKNEKDDSPMIVHNHITENHLHISKEDLKELVDSKKSGRTSG